MDKKCIICFCVHNLLKRECAYDLTKLKCCVCRTIIEIANEYRISNQFPSFLFYMNLNGVIIQFFHCCFEFTHISINRKYTRVVATIKRDRIDNFWFYFSCFQLNLCKSFFCRFMWKTFHFPIVNCVRFAPWKGTTSGQIRCWNFKKIQWSRIHDHKRTFVVFFWWWR